MSAILAMILASGAVDAPGDRGRMAPLRADSAYFDGAGYPATLPAPAVILFYANWCAPCRVEIRSIDDLARAAGPIPVIIVPWDMGLQTRQALRTIHPSRIRYIPGGAYRLMTRLAGPTASLPLAIALNAKGEPCNVQRGGLEAPAIKALLAACR